MLQNLMLKIKLMPNYEVLPVTSKKYDQEKEPLVMAFPGNSEWS
jgi:hypothetical protein